MSNDNDFSMRNGGVDNTTYEERSRWMEGPHLYVRDDGVLSFGNRFMYRLLSQIRNSAEGISLTDLVEIMGEERAFVLSSCRIFQVYGVIQEKPICSQTYFWGDDSHWNRQLRPRVEAILDESYIDSTWGLPYSPAED